MANRFTPGNTINTIIFKGGIMAQDGYGSWSTDQEVKFINDLGRNIWATESYLVLKAGRKKLLEKYLETCKRRENWGAINKTKVMRHTLALIHALD